MVSIFYQQNGPSNTIWGDCILFHEFLYPRHNRCVLYRALELRLLLKIMMIAEYLHICSCKCSMPIRMVVYSCLKWPSMSLIPHTQTHIVHKVARTYLLLSCFAIIFNHFNHSQSFSIRLLPVKENFLCRQIFKVSVNPWMSHQPNNKYMWWGRQLPSNCPESGQKTSSLCSRGELIWFLLLKIHGKDI